MSFGYLVGDFIAGANITYRLIRVLADSSGASEEYQEGKHAGAQCDAASVSASEPDDTEPRYSPGDRQLCVSYPDVSDGHHLSLPGQEPALSKEARGRDKLQWKRRPNV
jgi:hypothetical protein